MLRNPLFFVGLGAVTVAVAIMVNVFSSPGVSPEDQSPIISKTDSAAPTTQKADDSAKQVADSLSNNDTTKTGASSNTSASNPNLPSFDVVRVSPTGDAVIAGRALPGTEVIIKDGLTEIGRVIADDKGEWVYLPSGPLTPGNRHLSLEAVGPDGISLFSEDVVVLVVPERTDIPPLVAQQERATEPLAILVPRDGKGPSQIIQGDGPTKITFDVNTIDYTPDGKMIISGNAPADNRIVLFLDGKSLGEASSNADDRWSIEVKEKIPPGVHQLTAENQNADGIVVAKVTLPFVQEQNLPNLPDGQRVVVQPGNSLWRIARRVYGGGVQYTVIYKANQDAIKNPDLIYPGQVFTVPPQTN